MVSYFTQILCVFFRVFLTGSHLYRGSQNFSSVYRNCLLFFASFAASVILLSCSRQILNANKFLHISQNYIIYILFPNMKRETTLDDDQDFFSHFNHQT